MKQRRIEKGLHPIRPLKPHIPASDGIQNRAEGDLSRLHPTSVLRRRAQGMPSLFGYNPKGA